ncbi:MAG: hypothetical protein Q8R57_01925 [Bacteroidota bacterium]|nr:hypothetical protein [Bacteroidota bacterium]
MFVTSREGINETSTQEVKSLPRLRSPLTSTNKIQIRDLYFIGARSAELRLAVFNPNYFGDFAKIIRLKHRAKVMKVVIIAFPFLCQ